VVSVIFAVLDVSLAVNSCLNRSCFYIYFYQQYSEADTVVLDSTKQTSLVTDYYRVSNTDARY